MREITEAALAGYVAKTSEGSRSLMDPLVAFAFTYLAILQHVAENCAQANFGPTQTQDWGRLRTAGRAIAAEHTAGCRLKRLWRPPYSIYAA